MTVLDSLGVGEMPDAGDFGDAGSDTLGHLAGLRPLAIPNLQRMGIGNIRPLAHVAPSSSPTGFFGKMALASPGKDTTTGHWEMMGICLEKPFPVYPDGFPAEVIDVFEEQIGRPVLGNCAASGTEIIARLGEEHLRTGAPIVYTSADSVFQIAAHEHVIPVGELYRICAVARKLLTGEHEVGRVIARPFVGTPGSFQRTERRKDYAIQPTGVTVLDQLQKKGVPVIGVGKIASIFCHRGVDKELKTRNNDHTLQVTLEQMDSVRSGLIFVNFVDFDMLYGHRNDAEGYARALERFDAGLPEILERLKVDDLLILVSDHGCDPTTASTDHSREFALLIASTPRFPLGTSLGTRATLADVGASVAEAFGVTSPGGSSFISQLN